MGKDMLGDLQDRTTEGQETEEDVRAIGYAGEHVWCDLPNDEVVHPLVKWLAA